jgi:hypothetical protein
VRRSAAGWRSHDDVGVSLPQPYAKRRLEAGAVGDNRFARLRHKTPYDAGYISPICGEMGGNMSVTPVVNFRFVFAQSKV